MKTSALLELSALSLVLACGADGRMDGAIGPLPEDGGETPGDDDDGGDGTAPDGPGEDTGDPGGTDDGDDGADDDPPADECPPVAPPGAAATTDAWMPTGHDGDSFVGYATAAAWDSKRDRVVLTGGERGGFLLPRAFAYDGRGGMTTIPGGDIAGYRAYATMAYDEAEDAMVQFGGRDGYAISDAVYGDTLLFQDERWTDVSPSMSPPARWGAKMVYDAQRGKMWLFGGGAADSSVLDDLWTFQTAERTWTPVQVSSAPPARVNHAFGHHGETGKLYAFGGFDGSQVRNDTWVYDPDTNEWCEVVTENTPVARQMTDFAYVPDHGVLVIHGGGIGNDYDGQTLGDTVAFDPGTATWTELASIDTITSKERTSAGHTWLYFGGLDGIMVYAGFKYPANVLHGVAVYRY